MAVIE